MKKIIILSMFFIVSVSIFSGFVLSRTSQNMSIRIHSKDLPEQGLTIINPSDPSFDARLANAVAGEPSEVVNDFKPYSIFLENKSRQTVVAYMIQWCFTKGDGTNDCYRKAFSSPRALMEGEYLPAEYEARSGRIKPNSSILFSLISPDGSGPFRLSISREEAEKIKQGAKPDKSELLHRFSSELAKYTDVTVSIDGAFFEDGTFVGDDTSGFFVQIEAQINAKRDLLNELAVNTADPHKSKDEVFSHLRTFAEQPATDLSNQSTPADYYNHFKRFYANEILSMRQTLGDEKGLAIALEPIKKPWRRLTKKQK